MAAVIRSSIRLSDSTPSPESKVPLPGAMEAASRGDHTHPRLTSATTVTLDGNGFATITFSRTFSTEPVLVFGAVGPGTSPIPDFRGDLIKTGELWTGVTVYGQRNRSLPALAPLSTGISLISALITGLNTMFGALSGFSAFEPAAGAKVSVTAIQASA